jgi:uncharacterized OB-fold protein
MRNWLATESLDAAGDPGSVYQAFLDRGVFALCACRSCELAHYPPRALCPHCGSTSLGWVESSGAGLVYSVSVVEPKEGEPYAVALVDLDDGPRLMTNVVGTDPHEVEITRRVRLSIGERDGEAAPLFTLMTTNDDGDR